jgi:23S rRNA maturation-related 3'-5' exoribonuclease YhaM
MNWRICKVSNDIREKIVSLLIDTKREGIEKLIGWMDDNGFFIAPCSGQYHLCKVGGLAEHSLNVYYMLEKLNSSVVNVIEKEEHITQYCDDDSIILTALLHDLGKTGQYGKPNYTENRLKSGELSSSKPYETNKTLLPVPHEIRSIHIASQFIGLFEEEAFAILHHNGMYGDLKYQLSGKEIPLQMLLHFADMWASRVAEKEK